MARSAHYEGGLNTITRVFPAGASGSNTIGVMPKDGRIVRVRFHGDATESDLVARVAIRNQDGSSAGNITANTDLDAAFTSADAALAGVDAGLQGGVLLEAKEFQALRVVFTTTSGSVGEIAVLVQFDPR